MRIVYLKFSFTKMRKKGKLSATKITTYKGCSMAFFLHYVAGEKVPTNVRYAFGKAIHYFAELFYKRRFKSPESFAGFWKYYWTSTVSGDFLRGRQKRELQSYEYGYFAKNKETGEKEERTLRVGDHVFLGENPVGVFFGYMRLGEKILKNFFFEACKSRTSGAY
jgi:hypothetical protein